MSNATESQLGLYVGALLQFVALVVVVSIWNYYQPTEKLLQIAFFGLLMGSLAIPFICEEITIKIKEKIYE